MLPALVVIVIFLGAVVGLMDAFGIVGLGKDGED